MKETDKSLPLNSLRNSSAITKQRHSLKFCRASQSRRYWGTCGGICSWWCHLTRPWPRYRLQNRGKKRSVRRSRHKEKKNLQGFNSTLRCSTLFVSACIGQFGLSNVSRRKKAINTTCEYHDDNDEEPSTENHTRDIRHWWSVKQLLGEWQIHQYDWARP